MVDLRYFMDPRPEEWRKLMQYNIALQIAMCRLHYRRVPQALPNNIEEQAAYWKKHYNTYKGKGSTTHFWIQQNHMEAEAKKIDNLIDVMNQLKELESMISSLDEADTTVILGLILALIRNTSVPDVTILPNIGSIAVA